MEASGQVRLTSGSSIETFALLLPGLDGGAFLLLLLDATLNLLSLSLLALLDAALLNEAGAFFIAAALFVEVGECSGAFLGKLLTLPFAFYSHTTVDFSRDGALAGLGVRVEDLRRCVPQLVRLGGRAVQLELGDVGERAEDVSGGRLELSGAVGVERADHERSVPSWLQLGLTTVVPSQDQVACRQALLRVRVVSLLGSAFADFEGAAGGILAERFEVAKAGNGALLVLGNLGVGRRFGEGIADGLGREDRVAAEVEVEGRVSEGGVAVRADGKEGVEDVLIPLVLAVWRAES